MVSKSTEIHLTKKYNICILKTTTHCQQKLKKTQVSGKIPHCHKSKNLILLRWECPLHWSADWMQSLSKSFSKRSLLCVCVQKLTSQSWNLYAYIRGHKLSKLSQNGRWELESQISWFQNLLQRYSNQDSLILA